MLTRYAPIRTIARRPLELDRLPRNTLADCYSTVELPSIVDPRGALSVFENSTAVPFRIQRVYWLHGVPEGANRAGHAHRRLQQLVIAVAGGCDVTIDNGFERSVVRLDRPDVGLYLRPYTWRELDNFAPGTVLVVLASAPYDESDYIRSHDDFRVLTRRW